MDENDDDSRGLAWHDIATVLQCGLRSIGVMHGVLTLAMKCTSAPSIQYDCAQTTWICLRICL